MMLREREKIVVRLRRLRRSGQLRKLVRETRVSTSDLVQPIFVREGEKVREEVEQMPGVYRMSIDMLVDEAKELEELGVPAILLFGIPSAKDERGSGAYSSDGIVQRAVRAVKSEVSGLVVMTDVCLCQYTSHGHCGIVANGVVLNDITLELLARTAVSHAEAGADVVAPSAMMDHQVAAIREALDNEGFSDVAIMGYSAKFASSFYGPFREAAYSAPAFGDRRSYQMDMGNTREALREIEQDIREGADIVMVKPALAYLDVIARARSRFSTPIAAYSVSGEYSLIKAAASKGWIDERALALEVLTAIKRAGADIIITYFARDFARWQRGEDI